jgi:hydroxymethylbilane synthase
VLLRLGTRTSALARAQADEVRAALVAGHPGLAVELVGIRTTGDRLARGPLGPAGGKGLFVKEIEEALLAGAIDCAVHSMKDVPVRLARGCVIAAVPPRADPRDVLVGGGALVELRAGTRIGTASLRRRAQLLARRRDLAVEMLRGNVDTRLARWRAGAVDCLVLAAAGLARLGVAVPEARPLAIEELLPAVGQGALALECRADDARTRALLAALDDPAAAAAVAAERAFLAALGGDCNTPLAAHASVDGGRLRLRAEVLSPDGARQLAAAGDAALAEAEPLGARLAAELLARGAGDLLRA